MPKRTRSSNESHEYLSDLKFSRNPSSFSKYKRQECPGCKTNKKIFCYKCYTWLIEKDDQPPSLSLPLKCHIVQHPKELKSKSSAIHAKVISNDADCQIYEYPKVPDGITKDNCVLLYPSDDAMSMDEFVKKQEIQNIEHVVFIDSTWQQSKSIFNDPVIHALPHVKIQSHQTAFWRYQSKGKDHLATIEAIYWFYKEYAQALQNVKSAFVNDRFDDLLILFYHQYQLIQAHYNKNKDISFNKIDDYIQYKE